MTTTHAPARPRPQFRNLSLSQLVAYRLPPAGWVSIMHRASGAALFLLLPWLLWLFDLSLTSDLSFDRMREHASHWLAKLVLLATIWALLHHLIAGIRYLLLDLHIGIGKQSSTTSALWVYYVSLPLAVAAGLRLFGVI